MAGNLAGMAEPEAIGIGKGYSLPPVALPLAVAAAGAGACLLLGLVDPTRTPLLPPCPFKALTGLDCPGCGGTRAMHLLLNGHPGAALGLNVLAVVAVPLVLWWWTAWALPLLGGPAVRRPGLSRRAWPWALAGLAVFTVARNLPWAPFSALGT